MSSTTEKIYNSLKRNSSSTKPTSMNMEDIIKRSYELGLEFARRTQKKPIAKLQEGGSIEEDYSNYGSSTNPYPETEENYDIKNLTRYFLGQGVALGFGDELEAFVRSRVGDDTYKNNISTIKEEMKNYKEENPVTATIAEGAGALVTGTGIAASAARLGVKGIAKTAATTGAIEGGLYGLGAPETFGTEDRLKGSAFGAGIGVTAGTVLGVAGDQAFKFGKNLYKTIPTITRRNFVNNLDQGTEKGSIKLFHGDSGGVPDDLPDDALGRQMADIQIKHPDSGLTHDGVQYTPLTEFRKDTKLSLAVDKDNSTKYVSGMVDDEGTKGFLYEVSVPKDVIKDLFDPFNSRHRKLLTKELTKLYDNKQLDYVAPALETKVWKDLTKKQKQHYLEYRYLDPMQMQQKIYSPVPDYSTTLVPPKSSKDNYLYDTDSRHLNNWGILENRRTVMALKNLKFKGTWQKELDEDQIQIFDGSSVDIIPGKTIQFENEEELLQLNALDSFLDNVDTSKQGGVNIQTAEQFNKKLKDAIDAGEDIIFDGKKVDFGDKK